MTDTQHQTYELCQELYRLTKWEPEKEIEGIEIAGRVPAYHLEYLLEKLPTRLEKDYFLIVAVIVAVGYLSWYAEYQHRRNGNALQSAQGPTPLIATLQLAVVLAKEGVVE